MKRYLVHFTAVAERHLRETDEWWEANRPSSPGLFARELTETVKRFSSS